MYDGLPGEEGQEVYLGISECLDDSDCSKVLTDKSDIVGEGTEKRNDC